MAFWRGFVNCSPNDLTTSLLKEKKERKKERRKLCHLAMCHFLSAAQDAHPDGKSCGGHQVADAMLWPCDIN